MFVQIFDPLCKPLCSKLCRTDAGLGTFGDATTKLFAAGNLALTRFTGIMFADAAHAIIRYTVMSGRARSASASHRQSGELETVSDECMFLYFIVRLRRDL